MAWHWLYSQGLATEMKNELHMWEHFLGIELINSNKWEAKQLIDAKNLIYPVFTETIVVPFELVSCAINK